MEIIQQTYEELPNCYGACRYKYIAIFKMFDFYIVLRWVKFHNWTDGTVEATDCGTDLLRAMRFYRDWGGICE